ncbi:hypothetical protein CB1_000294022 [Camelus ferus]|nr:hypothetical protein CB1_000294022 [Camelus ferus]
MRLDSDGHFEDTFAMRSSHSSFYKLCVSEPACLVRLCSGRTQSWSSLAHPPNDLNKKTSAEPRTRVTPDSAASSIQRLLL